MTVAGAASGSFFRSKNSPTSHLPFQQKSCKAPESNCRQSTGRNPNLQAEPKWARRIKGPIKHQKRPTNRRVSALPGSRRRASKAAKRTLCRPVANGARAWAPSGNIRFDTRQRVHNHALFEEQRSTTLESKKRFYLLRTVILRAALFLWNISC
jgi:hypothetical protein